MITINRHIGGPWKKYGLGQGDCGDVVYGCTVPNTNTLPVDGSAGSTTDWASWLQNITSGALSTTEKILGTRFSVPQLQPGTSIRTPTFSGVALPQGSTGQYATSPFSSLLSGSISPTTLLLLGGGALVLIIAMGRR